MKNSTEGVWKSFALSAFPVVGGLLAYLKNKKGNPELARICLTLSFLHPLIVWLVAWGLLGALEAFVEVYYGIPFEFFSMSSINIRIFNLAILSLSTLSLWAVYKSSKYQGFIPIWYFGFLGAIYSYFSVYKDNKPLQKNVISFVLFQSILLFVSATYKIFRYAL